MRPSPLAPLLLLALALGADETVKDVTVTLAPGLPKEDSKLGYSSPRKLELETTAPRFLMEIPKFADPHPIFFRLPLGETKGVPFYGALDREKEQTHHGLLYLDRDRDLDLTNDGPPVKARMRGLATSEGKIVEFLDVRLDLPYAVEGKETNEAYACVLFYMADAKDPAPPALYVERDGWREGMVSVEGEGYDLALVDDDSDGQFTTGDTWVLRPAGTPKRELLDGDATRSMLFPAWTKDQKWTIEVKSIDPAGRTASLRISPAKESETEFILRVARQRQTEEEKELNLDPLRPKAGDGDKIDWITGKDAAYALAIANAPKVQKPVLLEFVSPVCPWCARMERYTFRDREVVALARRFVCARIPFSKESDDGKKYRTEGTPTYVILDLKGAEVARQSGFLRPTEFAPWLKGALR
ncbi:MAG: thioredoxin family protein [Planctomycetota bacterium]